MLPTLKGQSSTFLSAARRTSLASYGAPDIWLIRVTYGAGVLEEGEAPRNRSRTIYHLGKGLVK